MLCVPGRHRVRQSHVTRRKITAEYFQAYKQCCLLKGNPNDEINIDQEVNICRPCWIIIVRESQNPTEPALDFERDNIFPYQVPVISESTCFLCGQNNPLYIVPFDCRVDFFVKAGIFIPRETRCCRSHIGATEKSFNIDVHFLQVQSVEGLALMKPSETTQWFQALRLASGTSNATSMLNRLLNMDDDDFRQVVGVKKVQFKAMCDVTDGYRSRRMTCRPLSLILLMMKLRNAQYLLFLKSLFGFTSKRTVSAHIRVARLALMANFVPQHLGPQAHPRPQCLQHVNALSKQLHLDEANEENAILVVDGTYVYIPKSGNFTVLKRSYSQHKGRHLLKITMLVFPDGRIFDVHGPYLADGRNNDASTLKHDLQKNISGLKDWLHTDDVLVMDRGYRDAVTFLRTLGYVTAIPYCAPRNERQHPTNEANESRIVTKTRWVVEARNGHVSQIFKYFGRVIHAASVPFIGDYFRICCAVINAFYPTIELGESSLEVGRKMLELRNSSNVLMEYLEAQNLLNKRLQRPWVNIEDVELEEFPRLDKEDLEDLTLGVFQLNLAPSYIASQELKFQVYRESRELLRVKIDSRHSGSTEHHCFIRFKPNVHGRVGIPGYYCTCKQGARTIGMCSHTCAVLWYLGFARYEPVLPAPSNTVLRTTLDAAERFNNVVVVNDDFVPDVAGVLH